MSQSFNKLIPQHSENFFGRRVTDGKEWARQSFFKLYGQSQGIPRNVPFVLTIGLMRSGSSLLTQLICANANTTREIVGYGETHLAYRDRSDFIAAAGKIAWVLRQNRVSVDLSQAAFFDKSLHPYQIWPHHYHLLNAENVRLILMIRKPTATITSLVHSFDYPIDVAINYYRNQLSAILAICGQARGFTNQPLLIAYDDLLSNSRATLASLSEFLGLKRPLSDMYDTGMIAKTGYRGLDNSQNILAGKIVANSKYSPLPVWTNAKIEPLNQIYDLVLNCTNVARNG